MIQDCFIYALLHSVIGPPLSQPIKHKTETKHNLVACILLYFNQFGLFYFEFSLALKGVFSSSDWPNCNHSGFGFTAFNQNALHWKPWLMY